ncbi:MAG: isopeptide-forming domain-containing fimbrial protein [Erythrobacter sp.]|uniref:isopeptide-forming domain-containing fimbrial protein n=1 Tax=Erythrobacter sp. TaxID=1042 RepID=UPI003266A083
MRVCSSLKRLAAGLGLVLLPFGVLGENANAQTTTTDAEVIGTVTNTAEASWQFEGRQRETVSNTIEFDVTLPPPTIRAFRPTPQGDVDLNFRAPICSASAQLPASGNGGTAGGTVELSPQEGMAAVTSTITPGQTVLFEITALAANVDKDAEDRLSVTITTTTGDEETLTIFETGVNTGVFVGQIGTARIPLQPASGDCRLSINDGATIFIEATLPNETTVLVETQVEVLADPFGVVFDSETGQPVSGARVSLVDAITGAPATVFADDGVTPWPSTVTSGEPITFGNGLIQNQEPGEFLFPLTNLGDYRLVIEPPEPYTAPSVVSPAELARLRRPDGREFVILDASFGNAFTLVDPTPVQVDIPLDRPGTDIGLVKTASRDRVQPGDVVFYSITATNADPSRPRRGVVLTDSPSSSLRFRPDTVRVNGAESPDTVQFTPDGRTLTITVGDLAGGESVRVTYAMTVRPDASPGQAINEALTVDSVGRITRASAVVDVERETIADRMTIIGRITAGPCSVRGTRDNPRLGVPGVRVIMEDGSYAITDADGRYHFEGVVPGTHVVAVAGMTVPEGGKLVNCHRDTRNAGSASSRFVIGQGGTLAVADFHIAFPESSQAQIDEALAVLVDEARPRGEGDSARAVNAIAGGSGRSEIDGVAPPVEADDLTRAGVLESTAEAAETVSASYAPNTDWIALGDGEDGFLTPGLTANPRAPAIRVAIRHRRGQTIKLRVNGEEVSGLSFDGTLNPAQGRFAVSTWRGIVLEGERTVLEADVVNSFGGVNETFTREVFFTTTPTRVELVPEQSNLVADGRTRPVVAIRVLDRNNRPLREGVSGNFTLNAPYESAEQVDRQQLNQLTGFTPSQARWVVEGTDGIAKIELAPTMVSGSLRLDFDFNDGELVREQQLETWITPGDIEWTIVGLAEGTVGARSVAENMEREGRFDSDLGDNARVALYAKGRILGKFLTTIAYDSAKQREDQRVLGQLDPNAYYSVFADASSRRFDAASREKLYVRIETATFYALYGDFETAFDQTRLARYNRTATGVKAEARVGQFKASGFAADISSRLQREEIQGQGITGPYQLGSRRILANSERVTLEVRDRFRPEQIVGTTTLTRFLDYDVDLLTGTITFTRPVLSRDENLNPQFIVVEYETDGFGEGELNAGLRADWTSENGRIRVGANAITDKGEGARTDIGTVDLRANIGDSTEVRGELALSRREGETATGWLAEVQHQTGKVDVLAYARQLDQDYGVGQQNGVDLGRRRFGVDGRVFLGDNLSLLGSVWQDDSLEDSSRRRAAQTQLNLTRANTDFRLGLTHFNDRLADGTTNTSTVLEGGVTQRLLNNSLELSASTAIALDEAESLDLPARHRIGARYAISNGVRLVGSYEIADGENFDARTLRGGIELTPWQGGQVITSVGQESIGELGNRTFAAFGLAQTLQISPEFSLDATLDGNRTLNGAPDATDLVNVAQPAASGGQLNGGQLFEDFTAVTFGGAWRKDRWSLTARGEYRDGEQADRYGATFGGIRQLGEGSIVGSGITWTRAMDENGPEVEIVDAAIAFAHRPDASEIAMLGKLEYRSDKITGGIAGEAGGAGVSALIVDGDAVSRRVVASWSTNWSPRDWGKDRNGITRQTRRNELGLFVGGRYNFDEFEGTEFSGTTAFVGADGRIGIGEKFEIGASATVRANLEDNVTSFSYGPTIGFTPVDGMLVTVGYNVEGFRDGDFSEARNTDKGVFAAVRLKFDASSFESLGLGR